MKIYSYKAEDLAVFANQVKENLLISLENEGVLEEGWKGWSFQDGVGWWWVSGIWWAEWSEVN